jgi:hypothetical protein
MIRLGATSVNVQRLRIAHIVRGDEIDERFGQADDPATEEAP